MFCSGPRFAPEARDKVGNGESSLLVNTDLVRGAVDVAAAQSSCLWCPER